MGYKNSVIPNDGSVTIIGNYAFKGCKELKSITLPNTVTSIKNSAFDGCKGMTNITIPDSVTNMEDGAFYGCDGLANVIIGKDITRISKSMFYGCDALTDVYYYGTEVEWNSISNDNLVDVTKHYPTNGDALAPTCSQSGYSEFIYWSDTNPIEYITQPKQIPPTGIHTPINEAIKENEIKATCITGGNYEKTIYCSECGKELSREKFKTQPLGHSFTNYKYNNDATTEKDGTETAKCDRCTATDTRTAVGTRIIPNVYILTYDANGGTGAPARQNGNGNVTLSSTKPTKDGYNFLGWAESASAAFAKYQPGATYNLKANATLYAVWKKIDTPVNPTANARLNVKASQTVDYKANVTVTATATGVPTGYVLAIYEGNSLRAQGNSTSVSYAVGQMTAEKTFTVKVIEPSTKAVQKDNSGAELNKNCEVKVKTGFFDKLIAFFKGLFGLLPNVEVKP